MGNCYKVPQILVGCCVFVLFAPSTSDLGSIHGEDGHVLIHPMVSGKRYSCELLSDNVSIDCSDRGLSTIPRHITFKCKHGKCIKIDLSGNRIRKICNNAFKDLPHIEFIDLSKNNLTEVSKKAFNGVRLLKSLRLNNNSLSYDALPSAAFKPLSNLVTLFIENQVLKKANTKYPSQIFSTMSKLKNLTMDFVYNESVAHEDNQQRYRVAIFDKKFEALKALGNIVMFAPGEGPLFVPANTFQHVRNITALSVRRCRIAQIEEFALSHFTRLQSFDIGLNKKLGLNASVNLLRHLISPLTHLDLEYINPFLNPAMLTKEMMSVFKHLPIQNLSLVQDHITMIESDNLNDNWNYLRTIYIGRNNLVASGEETNLKIFATNVAKMSNLTFVDASYWHITSEATDYYGSSEVREPNKYFANHSTNYRANMAESKVRHIKIAFPPNLSTVILRGTFRPGVFVYYLDCFKNKLKYLDLSRSNFKYWPIKGYPYPCFNSLQVLNMGYNDFSTIDVDRYKAFPALKKLVLTGNKLYVMFRDQKRKHFLNLNNLTHLDLTDNSIVDELYPEVFSELTKIKTIILHRNRLYAVKSFKQNSVEFMDFSRNFIGNPCMNITEMPSLKTVNFSRNLIRIVSVVSLRVWRGKNVSIDFSHNPFNCSSCQFLPFLQWFHNVSSEPRTVTLLDADHYRCDVGHGMYVREVDLHDLSRKCTSFTWVVISTSLSIIIALLITLGSLVYRHRWTIRFWIVFAARRSRGSPSHMLRRFQFDAFVAYSSEDRHWVHDVLRARLEENSDFGLCIHYRNFLPGRNIEENVIDAIESSRHSMLVVSRNFLKSEWCIFEMHMARNIFRRQQKDVLLLILLEDIPVQDAPLTLVNLLRSRTYLKWPADDAVGQEAFWERLKETLKREPEVVD